LVGRVQFNPCIEELSVSVSVPNIATTAVQGKTIPVKLSMNDPAPAGKFSSALTEATQKATTSSPSLTGVHQDRNAKYSTTSKNENERNLSQPQSTENTTQPAAHEKFEEQSKTMLAPQVPMAPTELSPTATGNDGVDQAPTAIGSIAGGENSDFNVTATSVFPSAQAVAPLNSTSVPPFLSATSVTSSFRADLPAAGGTSDSKPPRSSNAVRMGGAVPVFDSSCMNTAAGTLPDDQQDFPNAKLQASSIVTVPTPGFGLNGTNTTTAGMLSNVLPDLPQGDDEQAEGKSAWQPSPQSGPALAERTAPQRVQNQPTDASAGLFPVGQNQSTLATTAALPTNKSVAVSSMDEPNVGSKSVKAMNASRDPGLGPANPSHDAVEAPVQKAESHFRNTTPHVVEHSPSLASGSNNYAQSALLDPINLEDTPASVPILAVADGQANAKFEVPKQSPVTGGSPVPPTSTGAETSTPASAKVPDFASGKKSKVDSDTTVAGISSSGPQSDGSSPSTAPEKMTDIAAANVPQIMGTAMESKTDRSATKSEGRFPNGSVQSAEGEVLSDKHDAALAASSGSLLQSARLVERLGQSELRVGIQAGEFGNVDIRTSMARNQFTAEISVERGELGKVLAAELPNLHSRLSEQRVPAANIILQNQSSSGGSAGFEQGSRQSQTMQQIATFRNVEEEPLPAAMVTAEASAAGTRLDIHM
jgi:flagellar hook-length control protein FliK